MKREMIIGSLVLILCSCSTGLDSSRMEEEKIVKNNKLEKFLQEKKKKEREFVNNLDFKTDSSITKYVDNKISFNKKDYIPENLVDLKGEFLMDSKGNQKIRKITLENLDKLSSDFYYTFGKKLKIISAYRSYEYQKKIKDGGCSDTFCAKAGYSEHQSGLAVDFWEASEKNRFEKDLVLKSYFEWMKDNGYKYGFANSYQKGVEIDGYAIEPWHWRYVGIGLANRLKKQNITFAEFYYKNMKK